MRTIDRVAFGFMCFMTLTAISAAGAIVVLYGVPAVLMLPAVLAPVWYAVRVWRHGHRVAP